MEQLRYNGGPTDTNVVDPTKHRHHTGRFSHRPVVQERCFTWSTLSQPELWQPTLLALSVTHIAYLILNSLDLMPCKLATRQFGYVCCIFGFAAACLIYVRYLAKDQYYTKLTVAIIISLVITIAMYVVFWLVDPSPDKITAPTPRPNSPLPTTLSGSQAAQRPLPTRPPARPPMQPVPTAQPVPTMQPPPKPTRPPSTPAPAPIPDERQCSPDCRGSIKCSQSSDLAMQSVYIICLLMCLLTSSLQMFM